MLRLTKRRREILAEKFGDLANLALAGLFFGQAIAQRDFSPGIAVAGIAVWCLFMGITFALSGGHR